MSIPKTDRALAIDPGWRFIGVVQAIWTPRIRRVLFNRTITTTKEMTDSQAWDEIISGLQTIFANPACPDVVICEDMRGVRYGNDDRGTSSASTDEIRDVVAVIRTLAHVYGKRFFLVRSSSGYAAMGSKITRAPNESHGGRKKRQKAANQAAAMRMFSGAENLTEHEYDACVHLGAVMLGKGVEQ
jgi:hypothetical protein